MRTTARSATTTSPPASAAAAPLLDDPSVPVLTTFAFLSLSRAASGATLSASGSPHHRLCSGTVPLRRIPCQQARTLRSAYFLCFGHGTETDTGTVSPL